jgi:hypothetical protein
MTVGNGETVAFSDDVEVSGRVLLSVFIAGKEETAVREGTVLFAKLVVLDDKFDHGIVQVRDGLSSFQTPLNTARRGDSAESPSNMYK